VPAGSGLGGSSALAVGLIAAVEAAGGRRVIPEEVAALARDIEAQVIQAPTGNQDHLAALHGGVAAIAWGPGPARREALPAAPGRLEERGHLAYLGASRASARANWDMVRRALDGDAATRRGLSAVAAIAAAMREALRRGDLDEAGRLLGREWEERRGLSPEVSTPETEAALGAALRAGADGGKICGAGGGGCLFVMGPPDARMRIEGALDRAGCRRLPFSVDAAGLVVAPAGGAP
jgi:D-glycero-alpha-D-manno-heptose-7-phosphate kinase